MAASNKVSPLINKKTIIHGHTFATNNYVALLSHEKMSSEFHVIQDFLALSDIGFVLSNPVKVSYKAAMHVWDTTKYDTKSGAFTFKYNGELFKITPDVVVNALDGPHENITNETLFKFIRNLGYNGETTKIGSLFRTKLKKE